LEIIRRNMDLDSGVILDYGCGAGWLSKILEKTGCNVIGTDINVELIKKAKEISPGMDFVVSHGEKLPFKDSTIDGLIGIAILHHLDITKSAREVGRVLREESRFLFMEPNYINPTAALGRRLFATEAHTVGEKPFFPSQLKDILSQNGLLVDRHYMLFFLAFALARFFKLARVIPPKWMVTLVSKFENGMAFLPLINQLNSTIVVLGTNNKSLRV